MVAEEFETLRRLGVEIEPFGGTSYLVRSHPRRPRPENPRSRAVGDRGWAGAARRPGGGDTAKLGW